MYLKINDMNLDIEKIQNGDELRVNMVGFLNSQTAQEFSDALIPSLAGIKVLKIDATKLQYISSAGLRVMLKAHEVLGKEGKMVLINPSAEVREVFSITCLDKMFTIE